MWLLHLFLQHVPVFLLLLTSAHGQYRDGDVRLVGGSYQWEGRVQVYMSGVWGTITDSDWTNDDAMVVCRKLGHFRPGAVATSDAYFGEGLTPVNLDSVVCSGSEYTLTNCKIQNSGPSHSRSVGVKCQPADGAYREGDIRLVGGPYNWEGRVEIFWMGQWGTISGSTWSDTEALVVCRQLQHSGGSGIAVPCCDQYGEGSGDVLMRNVECSGTEPSVINCTYTSVTVPLSHAQDVRVRCIRGGIAREGEIRLNRTYGSNNLWEGRVELFLDGEWGTICDDGSGSLDAQVVCYQLGYKTYDSGYGCCSRFGQGSGPIHYTGLGCSGSERRLTDCENLFNYCSHYEDWSVYCRIDGPDKSDIRLSSYSDGAVQVFSSESWIPVADSSRSWTMNNSEVVCRQLGFDTNGTELISSSSYTFRSYTTIDNVMCSGSEAKLTDCFYDFHLTYVRYIYFRVECETYDCISGDLQLVDGESENEGRIEVCSNSRWGTVCGKHWTIENTAVVCRFMGFSDHPNDLSHYTSESYARGTGPIFIDHVHCSGIEGKLWNSCRHLTHYYGCSHEDDVGLSCQPARCSEGQLRLTDGYCSLCGRIEMCSSQRWRTFDHDKWTLMNSQVACQELGYGFEVNSDRYYRDGGPPRNSDYFKCTGTESRLTRCQSFPETSPRTSGYDIGLWCNMADCEDGDARLMDGTTEEEGRVEVCSSGRWGTIGGDGWTETNSQIICLSLGYDITGEPANRSIPNSPSKPIYYNNIKCSSRDLQILHCGFSRVSEEEYDMVNSHAIVKCKKPTCERGDLRLRDAVEGGEGRLEVCFNRRWGTIDGDGWTDTDTQVACRQLGYSDSDVSYTKTERIWRRTSSQLPVFITLVGCYGTESNLTECAFHELIEGESFDRSLSLYAPTISTLVTSMDVSIACSEVEGNPSASQLQSTTTVANVAISIASILGVLVFILVIVVIVMLRKRTKQREVPAMSTDIHYDNSHQAVSMENSSKETQAPQNYEDIMAASEALPAPPRLPPKKDAFLSKPSVEKTDPNPYVPRADKQPKTVPRADKQPPKTVPRANKQPNTVPRADEQPKTGLSPPAVPPHNQAPNKQQEKQQSPGDEPLEEIYELCPN